MTFVSKCSYFLNFLFASSPLIERLHILKFQKNMMYKKIQIYKKNGNCFLHEIKNDFGPMK